MNDCAAVPEEDRRSIPGTAQGALCTVPLSLEAAKPEFVRYVARIGELKREAAKIRIIDEASLRAAVAMGGEAKRIARLLAEKEEEVTQTAAGYVKAVRGFVRLFIGALVPNAARTNASCVETILKRKIGEYRRRIAAVQQRQEKATKKAVAELQKKLDREAGETGSPAPIVPAPSFGPAGTVTRTETGTLSYQVKTWKARITDPDEVPREYCSPSLRKIGDAVRAGTRRIPGVRIFEETQTRFRT